MKKVKTFIKNHKGEIIFGLIIVGGIITYAVTKGKSKDLNAEFGKLVAERATMNEFNFPFDNLEGALAKFEELGKTTAPGCVALWHGGPIEGMGYLVQDLN